MSALGRQQRIDMMFLLSPHRHQRLYEPVRRGLAGFLTIVEKIFRNLPNSS
jgi:hypothetical protein